VCSPTLPRPPGAHRSQPWRNDDLPSPRRAKYDHPRCLHERDAAQQLVKFMSSPEAAPLIRKSGMEPPPP